MRAGTGIAGATLLYGPHSAAPDLLAAMQFLVDDLRGDGRRIAGLRLSGGTLRLRCDGYEIILSLAPAPLPPGSFHGVMRPAGHAGNGPDIARVHFQRVLQHHGHALGFLLRRRGAPPPDAALAAQALAREGRLALLPVIDAAPPDLLVWQPTGLVLTLAEFQALPAPDLLLPGNPQTRFHLPAVRAPRPARPLLAPAGSVAPVTRADRAALRSGGRLFGGEPGQHPPPLTRAERTDDALTRALRGGRPAPTARPRRLDRAASFSVLALWAVLLPRLVTGLLPF
jgi:hypothetical protein